MSFEKTGKSRGWHTAFYYLSRHFNNLTNDRLNDKKFYGLVGVNARYFNPKNPEAAKTSAAELSRTIHSNRYAKDMRELYQQDALAFEKAAKRICELIIETQGWSNDELSGYLSDKCWPDVWQGLENEKCDSRPSLNLNRIGQEARLLFGNKPNGEVLTPKLTPESQLNAVLHIIAFGFLDTDFMSAMIPGTISSEIANAFYSGCTTPCLVRYTDESRTAFVEEIDLPSDRPFLIGRRTDSDSIESNAHVGRQHGCIYAIHGIWYYEDLCSLNGSTVIRNGERFEIKANVQESEACEPLPLDPVALEPGDLIVVAGGSCYWFGERHERSIYSNRETC